MTKADSIPSPASGGGGGTPARNRVRTIALIVAAAVVVALVVIGLVLAGARGAATNGGGQGDAANLVPGASGSPAPPSPSASSSNGKDEGGSDGTATPKVDPRYGAEVAQTVKQDVDAKLSGGLTAKVVSVEADDAKAVRAGETAGDAVKVTISLTNGTGRDVSLSQLSVNAYYGGKATPAVSLTDGAKPLVGALANGATASGVYLYTVPKAQQDSTVITMTDAAGSPVTVFK
ncbi:hypothetical protein ACFVWR_16800 [Leifsonia sp. NPDC058292]|uniref:hypothetical protein n=1 Tax=Leifsonia sp. NPDC058292 TaxID=3346428 RepID=UPI0036DAB620